MCCPLPQMTDYLYRNHAAMGHTGLSGPPVMGNTALSVFPLFFKESIAASNPPGLPPTSTCGGCKWNPGAKAAAQGNGRPDCGSPALHGWQPDPGGNPSGLLNKGQSWILAMASVSLIPDSGPAVLWYKATREGRQWLDMGPARASQV